MALARAATGVAVAAGLAAAIWVRWPAAADDSRQHQLEARVAALEAAGPGHTERVIQREVRVEVAPGAASSAGSAAEDRPADTDAASARPLHTSAELRAAYAASFAAEPVDAAWAAEARQRYLPAIQAALPATSRLVSFECHSQFCDVALVHDSIDASNGFIMDLFAMDRHGPLAHASAGFRAGDAEPTADGKLLYHLYVARPGVQLAIDPSPELPVPQHGKRS